MANSVDPDQTAPLGAVWSGSALFAQAYLSENFGSLRYLRFALFHQQWAVDYEISKWEEMGENKTSYGHTEQNNIQRLV